MIAHEIKENEQQQKGNSVPNPIYQSRLDSALKYSQILTEHSRTPFMIFSIFPFQLSLPYIVSP